MSDGTRWPDWLTKISPEVGRYLEALDKHLVRLCASTEKGHTYRFPSNSQYNALTDGLQKVGVLKRKPGTEDYETGPDARKFSLDRTGRAVILAANGRSLTSFGAWAFSNALATRRLLDHAVRAYRANDVPMALLCTRAVIEHVAHFAAGLDVLREIQEPTDFEAANRALAQLAAEVSKSSFATRVDWQKVLVQDFTLPHKKGEFAYERDPERADRAARQILNAVDKLDKRVQGLRTTYEVLCEFAHPNVGSFMGAVEEEVVMTHANGVRWHTKHLGLGAPWGFISPNGEPEGGAGRLLSRVLKQTTLVLDAQKELEIRAEEQRQRFLKMVQVVVRVVANRAEANVDPYGLCPCGSEKKFKFCCHESAGGGRAPKAKR